MAHSELDHTDYGTGQKKLSIYLAGIIMCTVLTIVAFWAVMAGGFSKMHTFVIIYSAAIIQFFVQLICFLRLNTQTPQGKINIMSLIFTGVILVTIIVGSIWIMANLDYNMMH